MNTINTHKEGNKLKVTVQGHFNLRTKKLILNRLTPGINILSLNLIDCDLIDSEGVIFLHRWLTKGNRLSLIDPPAILYEILEILQLDKSWDFDKILTN